MSFPSFSHRWVRLACFASLVGLASFLSACQTSTPKQPDRSPAGDLARTHGEQITWLYRCQDGGHFTARYEGDDVRLFMPGRSILMRVGPTGSGVRYHANSDKGEMVFHTKGTGGILSLPGQDSRQCEGRPDPGPWERAALQGVTFRAIGHEPDWMLEITEGHRGGFLFNAMSIGGNQIFPWTAPQQSDGTRIWNIPAHGETLTVMISEQPCSDTMADEKFPALVTVILGTQTFQGCGRPLTNLLN